MFQLASSIGKNNQKDNGPWHSKQVIGKRKRHKNADHKPKKSTNRIAHNKCRTVYNSLFILIKSLQISA